MTKRGIRNHMPSHLPSHLGALAKRPDPMQTYNFWESKASELNFVGDLAKKVSKAVQSKKELNHQQIKASI